EIGERREQDAAHPRRRAGIERAIIGGDKVAAEGDLPHGALQHRPETLAHTRALARLLTIVSRQKDLADLHVIHAQPPSGGSCGKRPLASRDMEYGKGLALRQPAMRPSAARSMAAASLKSRALSPPASWVV